MSDLRASVRWRLHDPEGSPSAPWINYSPIEDGFFLHAYGHVQAFAADIRILAQCLRCERAEPGFIARILDTREDVQLASLSPDLARAARIRAYEEAQRAADARASKDPRTRRTNSILPPTDVTQIELDDLL